MCFSEIEYREMEVDGNEGNNTLYVNNLHEKIKQDGELKDLLLVITCSMFLLIIFICRLKKGDA